MLGWPCQRQRRNFGLQCILLSSEPSEDAHKIVREGSWQKRAGSQRTHLRGWGVMEALRVIPSQSPLGLKYRHLFCCNSAGQTSNPIHRVKVKVLAGLGPSRGESISLSFLASGGPCILSLVASSSHHPVSCSIACFLPWHPLIRMLPITCRAHLDGPG